LQLVPFRTVIQVLLVLLTLGLLLYGLQFLVRTRHRHDLWIPVLGAALARRGPAGPVLQQRHWALLEGGNLWEPARAVARHFLDAVPVVAEHRQHGEVPPEPRIEAKGHWWRRRALVRQMQRLWRLAFGPTPLRVSLREFA